MIQLFAVYTQKFVSCIVLIGPTRLGHFFSRVCNKHRRSAPSMICQTRRSPMRTWTGQRLHPWGSKYKDQRLSHVSTLVRNEVLEPEGVGVAAKWGEIRA